MPVQRTDLPMPNRHFKTSLIPVLAASLAIAVFTTAGFWQLSRAQYKSELISSYEQRLERGVMTLEEVLALPDPINYPVQLEGSFDNSRTVLLDNRMLDRIAGYHVLTLFTTTNGHHLLVNRGWIPRGRDRAELPDIPRIEGQTLVQGRTWRYSPKNIVLVEDDLSDAQWPLRVQLVDMEALSSAMGVHLPPVEVRVDPGYPLEHNEQFRRVWIDTVMGPERHHAYAVQWFALAATVVILFLAASYRNSKGNNNELDA